MSWLQSPLWKTGNLSTVICVYITRQYSWPLSIKHKPCFLSLDVYPKTHPQRTSNCIPSMSKNPNVAAMLRPRPTQIRPTIDEYLSPGRRREIFTTGYAFKTQWTRSMLLRLRKLDNTGVSDEDILATLQKEFKGPDRVEEIWQERALLATGKFKTLR